MLPENLKIEIRPIENRGNIRSFSDNLEHFSQAHIIAPFVNPETHKYETGLTKKDVEFLKKRNFPYDLSDTYIRDTPHEFWESSTIKVELKTSPVFLYPGKNLIDFVKYKYLMKSNYIYKSEEEMLQGGKPQATHFIYDESEAISLQATKLTQKNDLISKVRELSPKRKRDIIMIILNESTENKNEDYLTVRFEDIISNKELSLQLTELLSIDDKDITLKAEIKTALQKNVLRRTKKGIFYFETNLGFSEEDVQKELSKDENQELYLTIKTKIQN